MCASNIGLVMPMHSLPKFHRLLARVVLPPLDGHLYIPGFNLHAVADATQLLAGYQGGARAEEGVVCVSARCSSTIRSLIDFAISVPCHSFIQPS